MNKNLYQFGYVICILIAIVGSFYGLPFFTLTLPGFIWIDKILYGITCFVWVLSIIFLYINDKLSIRSEKEILLEKMPDVNIVNDMYGFGICVLILTSYFFLPLSVSVFIINTLIIFIPAVIIRKQIRKLKREM